MIAHDIPEQYSSVVEHHVMVMWVVGSIPHDGSFDLFFVPVRDAQWCNKWRGMCYPVCGNVRIKDNLVLTGKRNPRYGGSWSPLLLYSIICPTPCNGK